VIARFLRDERGTTAIEYALIGVIISVGIIAAVAPIGDQLAAIFGNVEAGVDAP
jgi:pilus assembly protein Flp/PilA